MSVTRSWPSRQRRIFHNCRDPSLARSLARRSMDFTFYTVMLETPTFYSFTLEFCTLNLMAAFSLSLEECLLYYTVTLESTSRSGPGRAKL
jgi:hypothetical protein